MAYSFTEFDPLCLAGIDDRLADVASRIERPQVNSSSEVVECIALAVVAFREYGSRDSPLEQLPEHQAVFAAHTCVDLHVSQGGALLLKSGIRTTAASILNAVALMQLDRAARALRLGDANGVATYMADLYFHGYVAGYEHGEEEATAKAKEQLSTSAQQAAAVAHSEVRALRDEVFRAYLKNHEVWGSKNVAAREIAKLVPLKERTIRDLLQGVDPEWLSNPGDARWWSVCDDE